MANKGTIDEIVDPKSYAQVEKLIGLFVDARGQLSSFAKDIKTFNDAIGDSKSIKDFEASTAKANKALADMSNAADKTKKAAVDAQTAQQKAVDATIDKVKAQASAYQAQAKTVDASTASTIKNTSSLSDNIKQVISLKAQNSVLTQTQKELDKSFQAGTTSAEDYASQSADLAKKQALLKNSIQQNNTAVSQSVKIESSASDSYNKKSATLDQLRVAYKNLNQEQVKNPQIGGAMLKQIQELDTQLKSTDRTLGNAQRNVGFYENALAKLPEGLRGPIEGITAFGKALLTNPVGIIVTALVGLYNILKQNEEIAAIIAGVFRAFNIVVSNLADIIKDALVPVVKTIASFLLDAGESTNFFVKALRTIVLALPPIYVAVAILKLLKSATEDVVKASIDYEVEMKALEKQQAKVGVASSIANLLIQRQATIFRDSTKSIKERQTALNIQSSLEKGIINTRLGLLLKEIVVNKNLRATENEGSEARAETDKKILELQKEYYDALTEQEALETKLTKERSTLLKEDEENRKKAADQALKIQIDLNNAQYELDKQRIENSGDSFKEVADNEDQSLSVRLISQQAYYSKERDLLKLNRNKELSDNDVATKEALSQENLTASEIEDINATSSLKKKAIYEKYNNDLLLAQSSNGKERLAIIQSELNQEVALITKQIEQNSAANAAAAKRQLNELNAGRDNEIAMLNVRDKHYLEQKEAINQKYLKQTLNDQISATQQEIDINKNAANLISTEEEHLAELKSQLTLQGTASEKAAISAQIDALEKQLEVQKTALQDTSDLEAKLAAEKVALNEAGLKKEVDAEREAAAAIVQIRQGVVQLTKQLVANYYQNQIDQIEDQKKAVDDRYQSEIDGINASTLSEDQKAAKIAQLDKEKAARDQELDNKAAQLQVRQARLQKAIAIVEIIANTGAAVVKQLGTGDPYTAFARAAAVAALGAVQVALVLATPIPKYEKGGTHPEDGPAIFGEKGVELRQDPDGTVSLTPGVPTLDYVKKGTKFTSHDKLVSMMAKNTLGDYLSMANNVNFDVDKLIASGVKNTDRLTKSMRQKSDPFIKQNGNFKIYKSR